MVDKTPVQIIPGTANDDSVVHASDASLANLSRSHTERDISRLQGDAPLFQVTKTYIINDLVTQNNIVYRAIINIPIAGAFVPANWEPVATPNRFTSGTPSDTSTVFASEGDVPTIPTKHNERDISRLQGTAPLFSGAKTYNVNDIVTESNLVYRNIVAVVVPAAFNPTEWAIVGTPQTPWLSDIDADDFNLLNLESVTANEITEPATPAAGKNTLWAQDVSGDPKLRYKGDDGVAQTLATIEDLVLYEEEYRFRRELSVIPSVDTEFDLTGVGADPIVTEGNATAFLDADGYYVRSEATAGMMVEPGGFFVANSVRRDLNIDITFKFRMVQLANATLLYGFFELDPTVNPLATQEHIAIFRDGSPAGNFFLSHGDGVTDNQIDLGAADTNIHTIRIISDEANSKFQYSWDGGTVTDVTTNIPAATTNLILFAEAVDEAAAGAVDVDAWYISGFCDK